MRVISVLIFLVICIQTNAQSNRIFGSHWTGSDQIFSSLDLNTSTFSDIDTLNGVLYLTVGESTFDHENGRYFNITNLGITITDVFSGEILDTIHNPNGVKGIEYNSNTDQLFGSYWNGSEQIFSSLDLTTKTYNDIDTLEGVLYLSAGESTFDRINGRYFNKTNLGITIIDITNGEIIDTINNPNNVKGIEYDHASNKIYGSYWSGDVEIFTSLDISTKSFTDIDTLHDVLSLTVGESTFDFYNGKYFNRTNLGITIIDISNGDILDTITDTLVLRGIEYQNSSSAGLFNTSVNKGEAFIYPNPTNGNITIEFYDIQEYVMIELTTISGQIIEKSMLEGIFKNQIVLPMDSGIYFIKTYNKEGLIDIFKIIRM